MDEATIEQVAEKVSRLDRGDHILAWDKKQHPSEPEARRCQADKKHGLLAMHGSGDALICPVARPVPCSYSEPVSR